MGIMIFKNGKLSHRQSGGQYSGEKMPGDLANWNVLSKDSNYKYLNTYGTLSARSGTLYQTYGPAKAAIDKQSQYAIGPGLAFRSQPVFSMIPGMDKDSARDWANDIQPIIDYYFNKFNFYANQSILFNSALIYGDSLLAFLRNDKGFLDDIIEFNGDYINWEYNTELGADDRGYYLGVKHDKYLRKYGIMSNNSSPIDFKDEQGNQNIVMCMLKNEARQLRGVPLISAVINLAKNDDRHHDATVARAVLESIILGNFKSDTADPTTQTRNQAARLRAKAQGVGPDQKPNFVERIAGAFGMGPGNVYRVGSNDGGLEFTQLQTPSNNFGEFKEWILNYIGAATGTPAQVILSKYNTSYTSHKGAFNDFIKSYSQKRKSFECNVMDKAVDACMSDAILQGFIRAPGFFSNPMIRYAYTRGMYLGPIPGSINPIQEATANAKNVENAFVKRGDIAAQQGYSWNNHLEEWGRQEEDFYTKSPEKQADVVVKKETDQ